MKLQFFHVHDLCRFIDVILEQKPAQHIFNVGNKHAVSVREWAELCYQAVGRQPEFVTVEGEIEQRNYFSFYDYEYRLDVSAQHKRMPDTKPMLEGLKESFEWYKNNTEKVNKKPYWDYIDKNLRQTDF